MSIYHGRCFYLPRAMAEVMEIVYNLFFALCDILSSSLTSSKGPKPVFSPHHKCKNMSLFFCMINVEQESCFCFVLYVSTFSFLSILESCCLCIEDTRFLFPFIFLFSFSFFLVGSAIWLKLNLLKFIQYLGVLCQDVSGMADHIDWKWCFYFSFSLYDVLYFSLVQIYI